MKCCASAANVFDPFPKWRNVQVDDSQPIQQILPKLPGCNHVAQVPVRRRDDADIDPRLRPIGADRLNFAILEKPQEERLHAQAHLADFVQEQRAAMRELQLSRLVAVRAGEAALDMSEELRLEERFREAGTIHRDERQRPSLRDVRGCGARRDLCLRRFRL